MDNLDAQTYQQMQKLFGKQWLDQYQLKLNMLKLHINMYIPSTTKSELLINDTHYTKSDYSLMNKMHKLFKIQK